MSQREIIERGFVYVACPPLYKLTHKSIKREKYIYEQSELDTFLTTLPSNSPAPVIQRYKG